MKYEYRVQKESRNESFAISIHQAQSPQDLHDKLSELPLPETLQCCDVLCQDPGHSHDRDSHVLDVMTRVIETSYQDIPVSCGNNVGAGAKQLLPGWKENVAPARDDSLFWHSIWLSCGRPNTGGLYEVMKWTRYKYHHAVRRAKRG